MATEQTIPWIPGMRATDEDGTGWRFTAGGVWFPDDVEATDKPTPKGALTADFSDMTTGVVVQWLVSEATKRNDAIAADPTHPVNVLAAVVRSKRGGGGE
jgi:hypothetical protein